LPNGAILDDLGTRFKVKLGDDMSPSEKLSPVKLNKLQLLTIYLLTLIERMNE